MKHTRTYPFRPPRRVYDDTVGNFALYFRFLRAYVWPFKGAVARGDVKALSSISGVGKKTAERIVVELKDKIGVAGSWEAASAERALSPADQKLNDAVLALIALGFKQIEAHDAVRKTQALLGPEASVEALVRASLKQGS